MQKLEEAGAAPAAPPGQVCFHCGEPVPPGFAGVVRYRGRGRPVCCPGCQAVAETIIDYGLEDYYRHRTAVPARPAAPAELRARDAGVFDEPPVEARFVTQRDAQGHAAVLLIEDIVCPACCWLIETRLQRMPGVVDASVNFTTHAADVRWDPARIRFSDIIAELARLGYGAAPFDRERSDLRLQEEGRAQLRRLGIAGLFGMQVMMIAIALYAGGAMEAGQRRLLHGVSLLLTLPVLLYAARPFFQRAWRDLRLLTPGMDVPVALGISLAFLGSLPAAWSGHGEIYFDSIVMFVFLLLGTRYLEFGIRRRAGLQLSRLGRVEPAVAVRVVDADGRRSEETVAVARLSPGDRVLVAPGATVPADGVVAEGVTTLDESLMSGESLPRLRGAGETVLGGTLNIESPVIVRVMHVGADTVQSRLAALAESCARARPMMAELADRIAPWFVLGVLLAAGATAWYWSGAAPGRWLPVTVSVLVVSCPCALSLATPAASVAAAYALLRRGLLVRRPAAIETLARCTCAVFDKTGTLTRGRPRLTGVQCAPGHAEPDCLAIAAALERGSEHPFARAITAAAAGGKTRNAASVRNHPGRGVSGDIDGVVYFLGTRAFLAEHIGSGPVEIPGEREDAGTCVYLGTRDGARCVFFMADSLRAGAHELMAALGTAGVRTLLLSGDRQQTAARVAAELGMDAAIGDCDPEQKLATLRKLQESGQVVAAVGDGINDAPLLAAADASIAMGTGTALAQSRADLIVLNGDLDALRDAFSVASATMRVIRQNLAWAAGYNLCALPVAAAGWIAPWAAVLGMSFSSLAVVANAARLAPASRLGGLRPWK